MVAVFLALSALLAPSIATADDAARFPVDWDKQLGLVLHEAAPSFMPRESLRPEADKKESPAPLRWIGTTPRLSLVARDWGVSQLLWGHLTVSDQVRLTRSSRMVVTRLRLTDGRLAPFAQLGLGQWRVDTSVMPMLPSDVELAAQAGGGFELELSPQVVLAMEADCTGLYREGREPQTEALASGHFWSTLLAARARF